MLCVAVVRCPKWRTVLVTLLRRIAAKIILECHILMQAKNTLLNKVSQVSELIAIFETAHK